MSQPYVIKMSVLSYSRLRISKVRCKAIVPKDVILMKWRILLRKNVTDIHVQSVYITVCHEIKFHTMPYSGFCTKMKNASFWFNKTVQIQWCSITYTGVANVSTALATFACKRKPFTVYFSLRISYSAEESSIKWWNFISLQTVVLECAHFGAAGT